jgi:hypothetical protein
MSVPDKNAALAALDVVQKLSRAEIDAAVDAEIGPHMLGVMKAVARAQVGDDDDDVARAVHLLVFGFLLRARVSRGS